MYEGLALKIAGIVVMVLLPPYLDGIARRVKARIQYRRGPPLSQTWYDLRKLFAIPTVIPTKSEMFKAAPYLALASALAAALLLPYGGYVPVNFGYNIIVFFYVVAMVSIFIMLGGYSVQNAFSHLGSAREMTLLLTVEPILAVIYGVLAYNAGSLNLYHIMTHLHLSASLVFAYIILGYALYVESGFVPFDVAEAEQELIGGPLAEYSGRLLGVFYYSIYIKRFALLWFFVSLVTYPVVGVVHGILRSVGLFALQILLTLALYTIIAALEATNARLRIDHIVRTNVKIFFIGLGILAMAFMGW